MKSIIQYFATLLLLTNVVSAGELLNTAGASGIALTGYDPVALFIESRPVHGDPGITAKHQGAIYQFASKENRRLFTAAPQKYVPQYGGYCAFGVSIGALFPVDINTWQIRGGKLYLNLNPDILRVFNKDFEKNVAKAEKKWPGLVRKHAR